MSSLFWYPGHERILDDIVRAENCDLYDSAGKRYVDLESGVWCGSIGHGHPRVTRIVAEQLTRVAHTGFNYSSLLVEEAAGEVLALLGFEGGKCVFLCSGSDAVEYGVRVAQTLPLLRDHGRLPPLVRRESSVLAGIWSLALNTVRRRRSPARFNGTGFDTFS
jgi:4-aminobutyrate aminotransferase-like enzyme